MAAVVKKVVTLVEFKATKGLNSLDVILAKTGKRYVVVNDVAVMLTPDTELDKPMWVVSMLDNESGETWDYITSTELKPLNVIAKI